jgi:tRNA (guanine-N7-)-methyltransferase
VHLSGVAPARPDRDARQIRSYARRGIRLNARQQRAWDSHAARWVVPEAAQTEPGFQYSEVFERPAPLLVEIGFGLGGPLSKMSSARPEINLLGFEVWRPGVATCLATLAKTGATNVRLSTLDAEWCFEHAIEPATIAELWTFFPDPWPKARHHKRRLIDAGFARLAASRLIPGGVWRLATDWEHYADQMQAVLDAEPNLAGGLTERFSDRPVTRFERRSIEAGRPVTEFSYTRPTGLD